MSLVTAKEIYANAIEKNYTLAAFNVFNLESLNAIVEACEEENSPAIIQFSTGARKYIKRDKEFLNYTAEVLEKSKSSFCLNHDHIASVEKAKDAIDFGFSSVMFDGSHLPYAENLAKTKEVVDYAKSKNVWVEAELGSIPGFEDEIFADSAQFTDPAKINDFVDRSGCNSLAISVGTAHGGVVSKTHLPFNFELLSEIVSARKNYPFVLHGGASMGETLIEKVNKFGGKVPDYKICSEEDIAKACKMGIKKVNMDVDNMLAFTGKIREFFLENPKVYDPRKFLEVAEKAYKEQVRHKLRNVVCSFGVEK